MRIPKNFLAKLYILYLYKRYELIGMISILINKIVFGELLKVGRQPKIWGSLVIKIIGNAISEDSSKQSKAKESFKDVLKVAKQNKEEYEGFEDVSPKDDGDDDGLDFLAGLGISRPK
jgi:hypothetical protein